MSTLKEQGINPTWLLERLAKDGFAELEGDFVDRTALRTMAHRVKDRVGDGLSVKTMLVSPTVIRIEAIPAEQAVIYRPRDKSNGAKERAVAPAKPAVVKPEPTEPEPAKPARAKRTRKTTVAEGPLAESLADAGKTRRHRRQQEKKEAAAPTSEVEPGAIGPGVTIKKPPGRAKFKVQEVRLNGAGTMEVHCVELKGGIVVRGAPLRVFLLDAVVLTK